MELPVNLKGMLGEKEVEAVIKTLSSIYDLKYLTDVVLPSNNGVTQIDLVIFSRRIFLCLEVKAWEGIITVPNDIMDNWKIAYNTKIINIFSPVDQNKTHTIALNRMSPNHVYYKNYTVFPTNPIILNKHGCIGNTSDLVNLISRHPEIYEQSIVDREYNYFKSISDNHFQDYVVRELGRNIII